MEAEQGIDGDTGARPLSGRDAHTPGKLIQLFNFLYRERGNPSPYKEGLNRYAEVKGRPKTLAADFINTSGTTPTVRSTHRLPATTHSTA